MGKRFCTACGAPLKETLRFCENCGAPADAGAAEQQGQAAPPVPGTSGSAAVPPASGGQPRKIPVAAIAVIAIIVVIAAIAALFLLPGLATGPKNPSAGSPAATATPTAAPPVTASATTAMTPTPDPFPNALLVKDGFPFGSGTVASEGTVYRVWSNETYQWLNNKDNKYYTQEPKAGNKYLFVFVSIYNKGSAQVWPPSSDNIRVYSDGIWYSTDPTHYLPDKGANLKDMPIQIKEVQYFSKLYGSEYAEDFGYSHGAKTSFLYPGKSNAIDGYLIYEVPASLDLKKAYTQIGFNSNDIGVWRLG